MLHLRITRSFVFILVLITSLYFAQTAATDSGVAADPSITIVTPTSGQVVNASYVDVSFTVANFTIGAWGASHAAFFLDADPQPYDFYNGSNSTNFGNKVVFRDFTPTPAAAWVNNTTLRFNDLSNGAHTITARLVDAQGNPLPYPTASFTVAFTVEQAPDNVEIPTPWCLSKSS
ncbi:MAG: hypothetical protein Fur0021_05600 [Candidatus Promineifilaceae bacterium]